MKLKSYFAATVEAAMNMARLELGDDAMLVSTKRTGDDTCHLGEYEVVFATTAYPETGALVPFTQHRSAGQINPAKGRPIDKLSEEVASLKREMEKLASSLSRSTAGIASIAANAHFAEAFSQLVAAELDAHIAQDVVAAIASQFENASAITASGCRRLIASELSRLLSVDSRLPASSEKNAIVLVGPPGAGKTTTLVKLAVLYGLGARRPSQILSLDSHRVASTEPLRSYAAITGLGFRALETPRSLAQALEEHRSKNLIFIDTPGLAGGDFDDTAEMAKLVSRHPQVETHLVLSASMKPADMKRIAEQYEIFAPTKLIFTHLDETATFGPLMTLSLRTGKPISFLSRGPQIPEDLEPASLPAIIDFVLKEMPLERDQLISTAVALVMAMLGMERALNKYQIRDDAAEERERLILEHLPQVRLIARRIHERLPDSVNLDDLVSTGTLGLIAAIDRFDPKHNVKLKTYAEYKIRGAILDSLRGLDWAPRQQRKRSKQIEAAISAAEQMLHRMPTEEEIAAHLKVSIEEYHGWLVDIRGVNMGSLEQASTDGGGRDLLKFVSDSDENWPSLIVERLELQKLLAEAIEKMPHTERIVLSLYYHEELTLREIAKVVKLHESRISQLKSQAILRLRSYMQKRWPMQKGA